MTGTLWINHYDRLIRAVPEPPILIGHSFGGTITQHLPDRGLLGVAGVVIDPAPTFGVLAGWQTIKPTFPVFLSWGSWRLCCETAAHRRILSSICG